MRNPELAADYVKRAGVRLRAIDVLFEAACWADVVRESQEVVELALKGLLRAHGVAPPRIHDMSAVLLAEQARLPDAVVEHTGRLAAISKDLRRDRELAFYGTEDLTPSNFYTEADAVRARDAARFTVGIVEPAVIPKGPSGP
jgi:hypothetical protein